MTHQSSAELASLEQAATTLNDSNAVSCTVHVFARNEAVPFPGIQEWKMTGIPGHLGNRSAGMQTLIALSECGVGSKGDVWWWSFLYLMMMLGCLHFSDTVVWVLRILCVL